MRISIPHWGAVCALVGVLSMAYTANAATIAVPAGGSLQAALNAAMPGDVITLEPGATYTGNFVLPNKGALTDFITIRSAAPDSQLPGPGVRMTPAYASLLPKIRSSNSMSTLSTAATANHYRLMFLEFQANSKGYGEIIALGNSDSRQTQLSQVPYALVLDRVYVHGDPLLGQKRGISMQSGDTTVINSYLSDFKGIGQDTQAIASYNGPGPYLIENNYLEAATENVLIGGADPMIPNLVATNVTVRHNLFRKQLAWRDAIVATPAGVAARAVPGGSLAAGTYFYKVVARRTAGQTNKASSTASVEVSTSIAAGTIGGVTISWTPVANAEDYLVYGRASGGENVYWTTTSPYFTDSGAAGTAGTPGSGTKWAVKNIFELKNAQDVLVEGNVFENLWVADQPGYPIVFTPRNQSGTAPWSVVQRVTFQYNIVRHTAGGVNILGTDNLQPSLRTNHLTIRHNVFDDMTASAWGSGSKPFQMGDGPDSVTIDHNTVVTTNSTIVSLYGGTTTSPTPITKSAYTNNLSLHNSYGIFGTGLSAGLASINAYLADGVVTRNVLAGGSASRYPAGNFFPTTATWPSLFVGYAAGDYHLAASSGLVHAGTDGEDLGADIDTVNAQTASALSGDNTLPPGTHRVTITTTTLPDAMLQQAYAQSLTCAGSLAPCAWRLRDGSLPAGLAFDPVAGLVFGTPTAVATGTLTVDAYDPSWPSNTTTATLTVTVDPPPFVMTMPVAPAGQVGVAYQLMPSVSGVVGTAAWSLASGSLPAGVQLDPVSGAINGTPSAWGSSTAVVQATDSWGANRSDSRPVAITIAPTNLAIDTTGLTAALYQQPYSAMLTAHGGTGTTTWSRTGGALPAGISFDATGVLSGTPAEVGTFTATVVASDANWAGNTATRNVTLTVNPPAFSCNVPTPPAGRVGDFYQTALSATGNVGTVSWTIGSGTLPPGLLLDAVSGTITGTPTTWGTFTLTVQATDSWGGRVDAKSMMIVVSPKPIAITTTTLGASTYQAAYYSRIAVTGGTGAVNFAVVSGALPSGLGLSPAGVVSGTPASVGTFSVTVQAVDANWTSNTDTKTLTLVVNAPPFSASIAAASSGRVGLSYLLTGSASGNVGAVVWSIASGTLPAGLTLGATGTIAGVPATFGSFTVSVKAQDSSDPARCVVMPTTISIAPLPLAISTTSLAPGSVRKSYQATLSSTGGTGMTTWNVTSGTLPGGVTLGANGVLSGTPTAVGTFTFTVQASDAGWAGNTATQPLSVTVGSREIVLYASDATAIAGTWSLVADTTAAGGSRLFNPDKGAAKLNTPFAAPANYFEMTFQAEAGVAYHLWVRGKAALDYWGNDSLMIQFSGSTDAVGTAKARIGTTSAFDVNLEDCSGCGISGWGWQDNGYTVMGSDIYFAQSGAQTLRVQVKEDGFGIDQIVLSADKYLKVAPGPFKNDATIVPR
jgi:hypothetical protein